MAARKQHQPPKIGTVYEKSYKGILYRLLVVEIENRVFYKMGRTAFVMPSAAAKSITGTPVNGWRFWKIEKFNY